MAKRTSQRSVNPETNERKDEVPEKLVLEIFKELAILKGERTPQGEWLTDKPWQIEQTLTQAIKVVGRAKEAATD